MQIWFIRDGYDDTDSIWSFDFYLNKETVQRILDAEITTQKKAWEKQQDKIKEEWVKKYDAAMVLKAAGRRRPNDWWVLAEPPIRKEFKPRIYLDSVDVDEN